MDEEPRVAASRAYVEDTSDIFLVCSGLFYFNEHRTFVGALVSLRLPLGTPPPPYTPVFSSTLRSLV